MSATDLSNDRSHALRGNASTDALRSALNGTRSVPAAFPRGAWERSISAHRRFAEDDVVFTHLLRIPIQHLLT
ncbi:hypothetical protein C1Y12_13900 [Pseudomonas sp. FW305-47B]|nr:hypothetical protein C1Y12_13900 [Pseudomonas sp. FW305-47B]